MTEAASLLVLPGLDGMSRLARPFQACLPAHISCTCLDFPGNIYLAPAQLKDWVQERLREYGPVFLLAQSWSAPLAVTLAQLLPSVRGLILVASVLHRRPRLGLVASLRWMPRWLLRQRPPRFAVRWLLLGLDAPDSLLDEFHAALNAVTASVLAARLGELANLLTRSPTCALPCPTLCLHAGDDRLLSGAVPIQEQTLLQHTTIPGPHLLLPRCPETVAEQVARFLAAQTA